MITIMIIIVMVTMLIPKIIIMIIQWITQMITSIVFVHTDLKTNIMKLQKFSIITVSVNPANFQRVEVSIINCRRLANLFFTQFLLFFTKHFHKISLPIRAHWTFDLFHSLKQQRQHLKNNHSPQFNPFPSTQIKFLSPSHYFHRFPPTYHYTVR